MAEVELVAQDGVGLAGLELAFSPVCLEPLGVVD